MVPRTWVFEVWYGKARLIKKTFNVYTPEPDEGSDEAKIE